MLVAEPRAAGRFGIALRAGNPDATSAPLLQIGRHPA
jgi:hypothetical protein